MIKSTNNPKTGQACLLHIGPIQRPWYILSAPMPKYAFSQSLTLTTYTHSYSKLWFFQKILSCRFTLESWKTQKHWQHIMMRYNSIHTHIRTSRTICFGQRLYHQFSKNFHKGKTTDMDIYNIHSSKKKCSSLFNNKITFRSYNNLPQYPFSTMRNN